MISLQKHLILCWVVSTCLTSCTIEEEYKQPTTHSQQLPISMETLLDEMVSYEESVYYPSPYYSASQQSSTDKRSLSPQQPFWFGNQDNTRYIRLDNNNPEGRYEKVIFDQNTPGAITRMWTTGLAHMLEFRFYFDGETTPSFSFKGNDFTKLPFLVPEGLLHKHIHYDTGGGTNLFLPIPYALGCRITVFPANINLAYHINYRSYQVGTEIETFSIEKAEQLYGKMQEIAEVLHNPPSYQEGTKVNSEITLAPEESFEVNYPEGPNAIRQLEINLKNAPSLKKENFLRKIILKMEFDDQETVDVPLGDFTGGGIGSYPVNSWYMTNDGNGKSISRWIMPYKEKAKLTIDNHTGKNIVIEIEAKISEWEWHTNTLYFHCSWKQEDVTYGNNYDSNDNEEWLFTQIAGQGVIKGDVLSLFNYGGTWYGEGDEKIFIDDEIFPSHFGTGTEDYYNTSWAPVGIEHTPFGGSIRADTESSYGYNTFLRTRNLDNIPFSSSLKFYFELLGWQRGTAIYSSTVFWYGALGAKAESVGIAN